MRKTILFCDNTLWGLLNFRGGVIRHFIESGYEVVLVAPKDKQANITAIPARVRYIPVELSRTGKNPISDWRYYQVLKAIYKAVKPDYIFHYTIKPNIYGTLAARAVGIRSSCMIAGLGHVYSEKGISNFVAQTMYKYAMQFPERVMVLNQANLDTLLERKVVTEEKLLLLKGGEGVDLTKFTPSPMPSNRQPVFLMLCRLLYEKGYAEYVAAAEALQGQAEFRIMGSIDSHPSAVSRSVIEADAARGKIKYINFSPDTLPQMVQADCIVLPSYHEGLSRVLMEGLAIGRPIITTDIPGCRETVNNGINGLLCAPRNASSLIEAMRQFITLPSEQRIEMGRQSRKRAEQMFDIQKVFTLYSQIIESNVL